MADKNKAQAAPKIPEAGVTRLRAWPKSVKPDPKADKPEAGLRHVNEPLVIATSTPIPSAAEAEIAAARAEPDHSSAPPDAGPEFEPGGADETDAAPAEDGEPAP